MKKLLYLFIGIFLGLGFTAYAATSVSLTKNGLVQYLNFITDSLVIGATSTTTDSRLEVNGTTTAARFVATTTGFVNRSQFQDLTGVNATTTSATTTNLNISGGFSFGGVTGSAWSSFCTSITGSADLCDGSDASGGGAGASTTLLSDSNTFTGENIINKFSSTRSTTTAATTTSFAITSLISTLLKTNSTGGIIPAVSSTDYAPATSGSSLQLANGTGGFSSYAGVTCTNQFLRALSGAGASTCATVANTDLSNSSITINSTSVSLGGSITVSSTTLLANTNTWTGGNIFGNATSTNATTTSFAISNVISSVLKTNSSGGVLAAANGTDYTLITANTCGAGQFFNVVTAAGLFTCGTPSGTGAPDFTWSTNFNAIMAGTSSSLWTTGTAGLFASGTSAFSAFTFTNATGTNATTTVLSTSIASTTNLWVSSAGGTAGCATFGTDGKISNTGSACGGGGSFPFTPSTNFNSTMSATSSSIWTTGTAGFYASGTSAFTNFTFSQATGTVISTTLASTTNLVVSSAGGTAGCATFSVNGTLSNAGVACGGSGSYPFTPSTNFNVLTSATSGVMWFQNGLYASSTITSVGTTTIYSTNGLASTTISANFGTSTFGGGGINLTNGGCFAIASVCTNFWSSNTLGLVYLSSIADDLLIGATATSSVAKFEAIDTSLMAWFASTTGITIRPAFTVFSSTTQRTSGVGINSSTTEDALTVNGRANLDPMMGVGCTLLGISGSITTDQLAGQLCDGMAFDSITDGQIQQTTVIQGAGEANMPMYNALQAGDTTSFATNEGSWFKTARSMSGTTTLVAEALLRNPDTTSFATRTQTYLFGLGDPAQGSLTTTAAYTNPTNQCAFQASSTPNWQATARRYGVATTFVDTGVATSTSQSTFKRFRVQYNYTDGCTFYVDGAVVAKIAAASVPTGPMVAVVGTGNNTLGTAIVGNHRFQFAEFMVWWGRWQPK